MAPSPNFKLDTDKAPKYVTTDGNRMSCGAPDCHFSIYKNITRLADFAVHVPEGAFIEASYPG